MSTTSGGVAGDLVKNVATPAVLSSLPTQSLRYYDLASVESLRGASPGGSLFFFDPLGTQTVDNTTVIATKNGTGRWLSFVVYGASASCLHFAPTNTSSDVATLTNCLNMASAVGGTVCVGPGVVLVDSPIVFPSNVAMWCDPGTDFNSVMAPIDGQNATVFKWSATVSSVVTTVAVTGIEGSDILEVGSTASLAADEEVIIVTAGQGWGISRTIEAIIDATHVRFDEVLPVPFAVGTEIRRITPMSNITVLGNGARIRGTGDRGISFEYAHDCLVDGFLIECGFAAFAATYDTGGKRNTFSRLDVVMTGGSVAYGIAHESGEGGTIRDCTVRGSSSAAFFVPGIGHVLNNIEAIESTVGLYMGRTQANDVFAARGAVASGVRTTKCATGIYVADGARSVSIFGWWDEASTLGANVNGGASNTPATGVVIEGGRAYGNGQGVAVSGGSSATVKNVALVDATLHHALSLGAGSSLALEDCSVSDASGVLVTQSGALSALGGFLRCSDVSVSLPANAGTQLWALEVSSDGSAFMRGLTVTVPAASNRVIVGLGSGAGTGNADIDNVTVVGAAGSGNGVVVYDATSWIRVGSNCDFNACGTPFLGGNASRGSIVSGGAGAAQAVAYPGMRASDIVNVCRTTNGGAPGVAPLVTRTAGVGFSLTFAAGDTSTYQFAVA